MTKPLMRGVIKTWKEDRGFGFISPEKGGRDVFVHISAIDGIASRHPEPGDIIQYQIVRDKQGKFRAINANIENPKTANKKTDRFQNSKPGLLWMTVIVVSLAIMIAGAAYLYFRSQI